MIGIHYMSVYHQYVLDLTSRLKPIGKPVVLGGPYVSAYSDHLIGSPGIDFVVKGEGEIPFTRLIEQLRMNGNEPLAAIDGVVGENCKGGPHQSASLPVIRDVDSIPFPAWDLVDPEKYFASGQQSSLGVLPYSSRVLPIFTSRGCPFHCAYCHHVFGRKYRARSAGNVVDEIEHLVKEYGVEQIDIADDNFNLDRRRVHEFCDLILSRNIKVRLSFPASIRADLLEFDLIDKLIECGLYRINMAMESACEDVRKRVNRRFDWEKTQAIIEYVARRNVIIGGLFILGCPDETIDQMRVTIKYAVNSRFHLADFFLLTVFRGTRLFEELDETQKQKFEELPPEALNYYRLPVNLSKVPDAQLKRMQRLAYYAFYSRPRRLIWLMRRMKLRDLMVNAAGFLCFLTHNRKRLFSRS